jgi:hypothetical protein
LQPGCMRTRACDGTRVYRLLEQNTRQDVSKRAGGRAFVGVALVELLV